MPEIVESSNYPPEKRAARWLAGMWDTAELADSPDLANVTSVDDAVAAFLGGVNGGPDFPSLRLKLPMDEFETDDLEEAKRHLLFAGDPPRLKYTPAEQVAEPDL